MINLLFKKEYKKLIEDNKEKLKEEIKIAEKECSEKGLVFQNKPFKIYPCVSILSAEDRNQIQTEAENMINILEKVIRLYSKDKETKEFFMLDDKARELVEINPGYERKIRISRFDTYLVPGQSLFKILENNTDCPAGVIFTGRMLDVMKKVPTIKEYLDHLPPVKEEGIDNSQNFVQTLLDTYEEFKPKSQKPNVGILQLKGKASKEVLEMLNLFSKMNVNAVVVDPREFELKGNHLYHDSLKIDLVWNKINTADFIPLLDLKNDMENYLTACKKQLVCQVNSFQARFITESKLCLAYLSDPLFKHHFTNDERELIQRHIPWSRKLSNGKVEFNNQNLELKELAIKYQDRFVIKTAYDIRGEGVIIGKSVDSDQWKQSLEKYWDEPFILQEFIAAPEIDVPVDEDKLFAPKKFSTDLFVFGGRFQGFGSKISDELKVNIFQNGSKQVLLSLEE